eukprot:905263-Rhodomonas_salina.1
MEAAQTLEALCTSCKKKKQGDQFFNVKSIEGMKRRNNQNIYVVRWEGYNDTTEEPEKSFAKTPGGRNAIDVFHGDEPGTYAAHQSRKY